MLKNLVTGTNLSAAACEELLCRTLEYEGETVHFDRNPGLFYVCLGESIASQMLAGVLDHLQVAAWCYREAAEVHKHPVGMRYLSACLSSGVGVTADPAQAAVWLEKSAGLGDAASKAALGAFLMNGQARAGVAEDAGRGFELLREAVELGFTPAQFDLARCYLFGEGVEKDTAHGVSLLRQYANQEGDMKARAETGLALCYMHSDGVEADTAQAAL
jgi:TPR repeat protein